jgi:hypothetical protein
MIGQLKLNLLQPAVGTFVVHRKPSWSCRGQQRGGQCRPLTEALEFPQDLSRVTAGLDYVTTTCSGNRSTRHFPHVGGGPLEQLGNPWRVGTQALPKTQYCDVALPALPSAEIFAGLRGKHRRSKARSSPVPRTDLAQGALHALLESFEIYLMRAERAASIQPTEGSVILVCR